MTSSSWNRSSEALAAKTIKALAHPLRVKVIAYLHDVETASPSELAARFQVTLGAMSYHVKRLRTLGVICLVRETPKRGAVEHHYALTSGVDDRFRGVAESLIGRERRPESLAGR